MSHDKILKLISNEAKDAIDNISIVTPSMYASIFSKYAKEHNARFDDDKSLASDLLEKECSNFLNLQSVTSKNINTLDKNTNKAITAIHAKDDTLLQEVLEETQALRAEVEKLKASIYNDELTKAFNRKWLLMQNKFCQRRQQKHAKSS